MSSIFLLKTKDDFHILSNIKNNNFLNDLENKTVRGYFSIPPKEREQEQLKKYLEDLTNTCFKNKIFDSYFYISFFTALGVFLLLYFGFSILVRDPIPFFDEFIIGIVGGVATFMSLLKHYYDKDNKKEERMFYISQSREIQFIELKGLDFLEESYKKFINLGIKEQAIKFYKSEFDHYSSLDVIYKESLLEALEEYLSEIIKKHKDWIKKSEELYAFHLRAYAKKNSKIIGLLYIYIGLKNG